MFKRSLDFVLLLLSLLQYINCDRIVEIRKQQLLYFTSKTGSCSEYFRYQLDDSYYVSGKLTLPHMELGDTVRMTFYYLEDMYFHGALLPEGSSQDVKIKLLRKLPISFRVDFPLLYFEPKLANIFINDNEFCNATYANTYYKVFTLEHTLNIINESVQVYIYNILIPQFTKSQKESFAEAPNESCGHVDRNVSIKVGTPLVYGGALINRGEYPWLVAIYKKDIRGKSFICGGSLVTSKIILSAAHCFTTSNLTAEGITTMLGRYNLSNFVEYGSMTRDIKSIILHPDYRPGLNFPDADLALLVMKEHVSFTKYIKPICLWSGPADELQIVNQTGVVVGWGSVGENSSLSIAPRRIDVKIVSEVECLRSSIAFNAITSSRTLCAGYRDGSGPCHGDSGGGLILNRNGVWIIRGVVSLGLTVDGLCDLREYAVYCDIAKHISWLQNHIRQEEPSASGSLEDICGISNAESRTEHPWLAAIYAKLPTGELFVCTGVIVSSRSILAPYNCFFEQRIVPFYDLIVYLRRYDLSNINEEGVVLREVEAQIFYKDDVFEDNNIALFQMKDPVSFIQYVKPICLWSKPRDESQILGQSVTLSGWLYSRDKIPTVPQSIEVNIASLEQCRLLGHNVSTTSHALCIPRVEKLRGRILLMKRNGRWLILGECTYFNRSDDFCILAYANIAEEMSRIKRNMLS